MSIPKRIETESERKARQAAYVMKWRKANPEKHKLARKRAYLNRKIKAMKAVGDVKCCRCGCDEIDFLEFNHINGGGCKEYRMTSRSPMMDRILTAKRKTDDLEIVCRVCNALDYLERKNKESSAAYRIEWRP